MEEKPSALLELYTKFTVAVGLFWLIHHLLMMGGCQGAHSLANECKGHPGLAHGSLRFTYSGRQFFGWDR